VLERYRQWLHHRRQSDGTALSWATQANKLTAVRMLLAWAARTKHLTVNPAAEMELPRLPKRLPRAVLTVSEMERVLAATNVSTALGLRDRAILEVLYSTGIRRMEPQAFADGLRFRFVRPRRSVDSPQRARNSATNACAWPGSTATPASAMATERAR